MPINIMRTIVSIVLLLYSIDFTYGITCTAPSKNKPGNNLFVISDVLEIGVEEAENIDMEPYQFYNITGIDCDRDSNIYVLDDKAYCIKIFDKTGKFKRRILRKGKGPQEISDVVDFNINKFTGNLFVLQDYGFTMKEFDTSGSFIKSYFLPQQFYYYFEFIDKERAIFITAKNYHEKEDYNFKILNIKTLKIEKKFATSNTEAALRNFQKFTLGNAVLWTSPCDQMKVIAYDLKSYRKSKEINIPGKYLKNVIKTKEIHGGKILRAIYFNLAHPFFLNRHLFVLVTIQDYKFEKNEISNYPHTSKLFLYRIVGGKVEKVGNLEGCDFMRLSAVNGNMIYLFSNDPYPRVKVIEIKVKKGASQS